MNTTHIFNAHCTSKILIIGVFLATMLNIFTYANQLELLVNSVMYSQIYCKKNNSQASINFIQKHAKYAANFCLDGSGDTPNKPALVKEFKAMLQKAKINPKIYGYYVGASYYVGFGTDVDFNKSEYWLKKSSLLGNTDATLAYAQLLLAVLPSHCKDNFNSCEKQGFKILEKLSNNPRAYEASIRASTSMKRVCEIAKIAASKGSLNAYQTFVYCEVSGNKKQVTPAMKVKLSEVINNKLTSIAAKTAAAQLLNDKKTYALLKPLNQ